jgi:hypothetical protein
MQAAKKQTLALALALSALAMTSAACTKSGAPIARAPRTDVASVSLSKQSAEAHAKLRGTWTVDLSSDELRLLSIARLALAEGNRDKDLEALSPTKGERDFYENLVSLSQAFDPRVDALEKQCKDAELTVIVTEDQVKFRHPGDTTEKSATFWIEAEQGKELTIRMREADDAPVQKLIVTLVDDDTIMVKRETDEKATRFIRKR